jgi:hypothetical protein
MGTTLLCIRPKILGFLKLAKRISRAALFYAKGKLERLGYTFPDDHTVHTMAIDALMDRGETKMGSRSDVLREKTRIADYYMDTPMSEVREITMSEFLREQLILWSCFAPNR